MTSVERPAPFCPRCNALLQFSNGAHDKVLCSVCDHAIPLSEASTRSSVLSFAPKRELDLVRRDRERRANLAAGGSGKKNESDNAVVNETCPKCSFGQASFFTMQLRSADEGQTVFYTCLKCAHKWSVNN
eukprot:ANDGO_07511.mRNA.1 DNA-directed RNA polymerase I subunit RPA12